MQILEHSRAAKISYLHLHISTWINLKYIILSLKTEQFAEESVQYDDIHYKLKTHRTIYYF